MIVNPKLKEVFKKISEATIKYMNSPDNERKYLLRLLKIYKEKLTVEEQLFLFKFLLEHLHFKFILTDPDNILQIHNIKLRTITYIFILIIILLITIAILFKTNDSLNNIILMFSNIFKFLF